MGQKDLILRSLFTPFSRFLHYNNLDETDRLVRICRDRFNRSSEFAAKDAEDVLANKMAGCPMDRMLPAIVQIEAIEELTETPSQTFLPLCHESINS